MRKSAGPARAGATQATRKMDVRPKESTAIARGDKRKLRPQEELYIALDDFDLSFTQSEMKKIKELWLSGASLQDIVAKLGRDAVKGEIEIMTFLMDQAYKGRIKEREGYIFGSIEKISTK